jgi:hypothetical protein
MVVVVVVLELVVWLAVCVGGVSISDLSARIPAHTPVMLLVRGGIPGTLEPVRALTGLTVLLLATNDLGGMPSIDHPASGGCKFAHVWMVV